MEAGRRWRTSIPSFLNSSMYVSFTSHVFSKLMTMIRSCAHTIPRGCGTTSMSRATSSGAHCALVRLYLCLPHQIMKGRKGRAHISSPEKTSDLTLDRI